MLPTVLLVVLQSVVVAPGATAMPADPPPRLITQYKLERWTDTDGLPQNSLFAVAQTADRFLWFASEEGLIRFDGDHFSVYNHVNTPDLGQSQMLSLAPGAYGDLWIGSAGSGLLNYRRGAFRAWRQADGLPSDRVQAVVAGGGGIVWIGTNRGLARLDADNTIRRVQGLPHEDVQALLWRDGTLWVGTPAGLTRVQGSDVRTFGRAEGLHVTDVRALAAARAGGVWVGTMGGGLLRFDGTRFAPLDARLAAAMVTAVAEDAGGGVWVGTNGSGLQRWRGGRLEVLNGRNGGADMVWGLLRDADGSIWAATNGSGLLQLRASPIVPLGAPEGLSEDIALAVLQTRDGSRWVGTPGAGLNRIAPDGTVTRLGAAQGLAATRVLSLAELPDGDLLVGSMSGLLFRHRGGRFTEIGSRLGLRGSVMAILPDERGSFWLGTTSGLVFAGGAGATVRITADDGLADNFVMTLHRGRDGAIWVGTRQGVSRVVDGRVVPWIGHPDLAGVPVGAFFDPGTGAVWAATQGRGIVRVDTPGSRFLSVEQGLCEDMVHAIVDDGEGGAWMSSNRGIFRATLQEITDYFAGARDRVSCRLYDRGEGMRSREANGGFMPAAARLDDGRIMFPTMQGVVTFHPASFAAAPAPPPPSLVRAVVNGDTAGPGALNRLLVTTGRRDIELHFTAPSYRGPSRLRFRYRLEGFDSEWRAGGARRTAQYTNLPAGEYVFRVQAGNEEGVWHGEAAAVTVVVPHRYHETWWFRLLAAAALLALIVRLHALRTRAVQRNAERLQALVEERTRAEARYRDLFENASDMVFTTDAEGVVTSWNSQAELLTGWPAPDAVGRPIGSLIPQVGSIADTSRRDVSFRTRGGEGGVVEIAVRPIEEQGQLTGYQVIGRDMRQWRHMQTQLQHAAKMEAVGQLAGGIAHDFNNLLTVITSSSAILDGELSPGSPLRSDVHQIRAAADSAADLTRQLLAFSRRQVLQPRVVNVNREVVKVVTMLRRIIGVDIQLDTSLAPDVWPVCADGGQLEQVLMNLALNARDAMPNGGVLELATSNLEVDGAGDDRMSIPAGSYVVLTIADSGHGINEDVLPHLFEPFFTTKEAGRGTGLGLATVYGVVKQSGGHILVDSAVGEGTRFRIFLPRCEQAVQDPVEGTAESAPVGSMEATIVLAEDEPAVRKLAERILTRQGFRVHAAGSGAEALHLMESVGHVDLLLTDVVMPGMNGRELAQRVRQRIAGLPILYMSGYTEDEVIRGGSLPEGENFLAKPFTPRGLIDAVVAALAGNTVTAGH